MESSIANFSSREAVTVSAIFIAQGWPQEHRHAIGNQAVSGVSASRPTLVFVRGPGARAPSPRSSHSFHNPSSHNGGHENTGMM